MGRDRREHYVDLCWDETIAISFSPPMASPEYGFRSLVLNVVSFCSRGLHLVQNPRPVFGER